MTDETPTPQSTLDLVMSMDPTHLQKEHIDGLIRYYRTQRGKMTEGIKPTRRATAAKPQAGPKLDLAALGIAKPASIGLKRRV